MKSTWMAVGLLLASVGTATAQGPQGDTLETRVYNVEFATKGFRHNPGPPIGLGFDASSPVEESKDVLGADPLMTGEDLVTLIRQHVAPETWESERCGILDGTGVLVITNRRSIHAKVTDYLAYLRSMVSRLILIDAAMIRIDSALLAEVRASGPPDSPFVLPAVQVKRILDAARDGKGAEVVGTLRTSALSGQRVSLRDVTRHALIRDYDVQIATGAFALDPVPDEFAVGRVLDIRPFIEPFGNRVTIEVRAALADLEGQEEGKLRLQGLLGGAETNSRSEDGGKKQEFTARTGGGVTHVNVEATVHHPRVALDVVRTTLVAGENQTALVGGVSRGGRSLVILITPAVISVEDRPVAEPAFEDQRFLRAYDLSSLSRGVPMFRGPKLGDWNPSSTNALTGATFVVDDDNGGLRVEEGDLTALLKQNVAPDSWSDERNQLVGGGTLTLIRQKSEALRDLELFLGSLMARRAVMVTTEAVVIGFRKGARAVWEKEIPALGSGGYFAEADKVAKLLTAAGSDPGVRVLERAEVTGFPQQEVCAARLQEELLLVDYESQISTGAMCWDPVFSILRTGFALDACPQVLVGTDRVAVDLKVTLAGREIKTVDKSPDSAGYVHHPRVTELKWATRVTCQRDRYSVAGLETRRIDGEIEEVVLLVRARAGSAK